MPQRDFTPQGDGVAGLYVAAALGTAFAGGLFPTVVFLAIVSADFVAGGPQAFLHDLDDAIVVLLGGFFAGFFIAAAAALCIFPLVGVLDWVASLRRWRGMLVSCAGGWCGFASIAALTQFARDEEPLILALGAMSMGQIGAGLMIRRLARRHASLDEEDASPKKSQLPLRQLFGITTAVAIAAAVLAALPVPSPTYSAMGLAAACQAAVVSGYLLVGRFRRGVSVDSLPLAIRADVPRETIGATPLD
jgi:hypothetical protein